MYLERTENRLRIMEEIGNLLIKDQIGSLWIKGISNALIVEKRDTLNLSVEQNQRIELITEISGSWNLNNQRSKVAATLKWRK